MECSKSTRSLWYRFSIALPDLRVVILIVIQMERIFKEIQKNVEHFKRLLEENHDLTGFIIGTLSGLMPLMMPYNIGKYGDCIILIKKMKKQDKNN